MLFFRPFQWNSCLIWLKSGNSKPYTKNEAFLLSFLSVIKNRKIGPKSVSSFSSSFTVSQSFVATVPWPAVYANKDGGNRARGVREKRQDLGI